ncbi:PREDICTED: probable hydrolase PNKD [Crocodylus porosus]|uniref:probable hydrolase PNKD n=1 Tax=Crocodylus porosus TaxID=8502 RepID=UPI00093A38F0|nr:PREDICTED: probable hydrolase PNKD [Crocodylus porosus]
MGLLGEEVRYRQDAREPDGKRYSLYAHTRLGYLFYKRQVRKARERYPHGHSVPQPVAFPGAGSPPSPSPLCPPSPVLDGARIGVGELRFTARHTPGHTVGHMIYVLDGTPPAAPPCLFSGDLLFLSGCGRIFEGTPETMLASLDTAAALGEDTLLWPGHEYALECLGFASLLDADNPQLEQKLRWAGQQRLEHRSTCPSTLGEERAYNPFLRTQSPEVQAALGLRRRGSEDGAAFRARVLGELRRRKDHYRAP